CNGHPKELVANSATPRSSQDRAVLSSYLFPPPPYFRRNQQDIQPTREVSPGKKYFAASGIICDTWCDKDCRRVRRFEPPRTTSPSGVRKFPPHGIALSPNIPATTRASWFRPWLP